MNSPNCSQYYAQNTLIGVPFVPFTDMEYEGFTQTPTPGLSPHLDEFSDNPTHFDVAEVGVLTNEQIPVEEVVSVATAFHPTAYPQLPPADRILSSSDGVLFYVHSINMHESAFTSFLDTSADPKFPDTVIPIASSTSAELNVILHMLYGLSSAPFSPSFDLLVSAVDKMPDYSITPCRHIFPETPLFNLLLSHAPLHPLDVYALAAHHSIHPLAVLTSSHLLSYPLQNITDAEADRMGAIYLKKLVALHVIRFNALREVLLKPPYPHPPTRDCDFSTQKKLTRAWSLVSAHLAWDARPDLSAHSMQAALLPLLIQLDCEDCQGALRDRIKDLIVRWTAVSMRR